MFYFSLLQGKTALKPPQKFTFQAGITAHQPNEINCGYFAIAAAQQIMESPPPLTDLVLVNEDRDTLAHRTKHDIIKTFKRIVREEGFKKGWKLSKEVIEEKDKKSSDQDKKNDEEGEKKIDEKGKKNEDNNEEKKNAGNEEKDNSDDDDEEEKDNDEKGKKKVEEKN